MSVFNRFSTTDRMILSGSFVVLLLLSYLLYDDSLLFPKNRSGNQEAIGTISKSENDVRRKNSDGFIWLPGNKKDQIYNQDSIFTGDGSKASITLNDGSLIQIQENSLVNLNLKNGQMQLDLRFGQFSGSVTPLHVKAGNEEYTIEGKNAKFEINRSQNGTLDVRVLSGDAEIQSQKGKQTLKANESLQISKNGAEKSEVDAKIQLLTKDDISLFRAKDHDPLLFEWEGHGPLNQYQLEVSKTEDFKKVLVVRSTADQKYTFKDTLREGPYFWRVKGLDVRHKAIATSDKRKFYLSLLQAPNILTPEDGVTLKNKALNSNEGLMASAKVQWEAGERLVQFEWQLSNREDFSSNLEQKTLATKEVQTASLHQGTYYTRVRGFDKDKHPSPWSEPHTFNFEIKQEEKPPAPRLVEKHIHFQIPKLEGRAPSADNSPQMSWTDVEEAKNYKWEISKNARFVGVQTTDTDKTRIAWTQYKPGKYYYHVFSRTDLGQLSDASETGVLEVFGDRPVLSPIAPVLVRDTNVDAKAPPKDVRVQWSPIPDAKSYLVQVDKTEEFNSPTQQEVNTTETAMTLNGPGKYFVRVKALNESAADMSEFSNVQDASYVFRINLKAPQLIEPYDKGTVFLQKDTVPLIWLEWKQVPDAAKYFVEVATTADFADPLISKETTDTHFYIKEKIPYGNIFWRVRSIAKDQDLSSEWGQRQFILYHQRNQGF